MAVDSSQKLLPRYVGPYPVVRMVGNSAVKLQLPHDMQVHNTFHVSLVRLYRTSDDMAEGSNSQVPMPPNLHPPSITWSANDPFYKVERILDYRARRAGAGRRKRLVHEYLVKWVGYTSEHNSWEPASNFTSDLSNEMAEAKSRALGTARAPRPEGE